MTTTRARIIEQTTHLFTSQGYTGTGLKQIATQAAAPFGSIYHFFPGGKRDLAATVLRESGTAYGLLVPLVYDGSQDVVTGTANFFAGAAQHLVDTDWADACPIGTVALEVASTDDELRVVIADVFEGWLQLLDVRLVAAGISPERARELSHTVLAALEGGFMLCRTLRTTRPLLDAGTAMAGLIADALPRRRTTTSRTATTGANARESAEATSRARARGGPR